MKRFRVFLVFAAVALVSSDAVALPWTAPAWDGPSEDAIRCPADEVLPAGVFHRTVGWYQRRLASCPAPRVATVAGVFSSIAEAQEAMRRAPDDLAPGYPWVTHTRAAGLADDGIAVVLAQHATRKAAAKWKSTHAPEARPIDVLPEDPALARKDESEMQDVVHVESATAAYDARVARVIQRLPGLASDLEGKRRLQWIRRMARTKRKQTDPICYVDGGSLFAFDDEEEVRSSANVWRRAWQPVRCSGRIAWVPVQATRVGAVFWRHRDGTPRVTQVTFVECDMATHTTWKVSERGRVQPRAVRPGCGP